MAGILRNGRESIRLSRRAVVKAALALLVGVPGTVVFLPFVALLIAGSLFSPFLAGSAPLLEAVPLLLWGLAGLVGLAGFWAWVFASPAMARKGRIAIAACVFTGVCSVLPFLFASSSLHASLAGIGVVLGILICLWQVRPSLPLNPDV